MLIGGFLAEYITVSVAIGIGILLALLALVVSSMLESVPINRMRVEKRYRDHLKDAIRVVTDDSRLPTLITTSSLNYAGYFIVVALALQPILYDDLESLFLLTIAFALLQMIQAFSHYIGGQIMRFSDIATALVIWTAVPLIYFILFLTIAFNWSVYIIIVVVGALFAAFGLYNPQITQFYQRLTPDEHRAAVTSLTSTARSTTAIIFTVIGGIMFQYLGALVLLLTATVLALISFGLLCRVWYNSQTLVKLIESDLDSLRKSSKPSPAQLS